MFFNKNLYKQISNCKYTTKQAVTYFLLGYYNTKRINTDSIIKSIIKQVMPWNRLRELIISVQLVNWP